MKKGFLIILGSILGLWAISFVLLLLLQNTSFNPFSSSYNISGKIINYDSKNLGDQFPLEVELYILTGNPIQWDEKPKVLIYQIGSDGTFKLENILGYNLTLSFRSIDSDYQFGDIVNKNNILSIDLVTLKKYKRDFFHEKVNKDMYIYK